MYSRNEQYLEACCNKSGTDELPKPVSRNETLLYRLAEELSKGSDLPTGDIPYQQLVTDSTGTATWEDRLAYVEQSFEKITYDSHEETDFNNSSEGTYEGQFPVNISNSGCPDGTKLKISLDGTEYITNVSVIKESGYTFHVAGNLHFINQDAPDTGEPFYAIMRLADEVTAPGQSICQFFTTLSGDKHTVKIFLAEEIVHPVDEKFMPVLTSPNGTKFKITVNDTGTIFATEVTS